ncbi:hypothetical protein D3C72_1295890 [compost metagenome]
MFWLKMPADSPNGVLLALAMAASKSSNGLIAARGANASWHQTRPVSGTLVRIAGVITEPSRSPPQSTWAPCSRASRSHCSVRVAASRVTSGPMRVAGSRGSPAGKVAA